MSEAGSVGEAKDFRISVEEATFGIKVTAGMAAVFVVIGFFMGQAKGAMVGGALGLLVLAIAAIQRLRAGADRSVHLRIDRFGIAAPHIADHTIAWSNIAHVKFWTPRRKPMHMCLRLHDNGAAGLRGLHAFAASMNDIFHGSVILEVDMLEGEPADIAQAIQTFSPRTMILHR